MAKAISMDFIVKDDGSLTVTKATTQMKNDLDSVERKSTSVTTELTRQWKNFIGLFATGVTFTILKNITKDAIDTADAISKLSTKTGASVTELDKLRQIAELANVGFSELSSAIQFMQRNIEEAKKGTGGASEALKELGIEIEGIKNLKPEEQFMLIASSLDLIKDSGKRVSLSMELMGRGGASILQMLPDLNENFSKFNTNLSPEKAKAAADFNDRITEIKETFRQMAMEFIPSLNKGLQFLNQYLTEISITLGILVAIPIVSMFSGWLGILNKILKSLGETAATTKTVATVLDSGMTILDKVPTKAGKATSALKEVWTSLLALSRFSQVGIVITVIGVAVALLNLDKILEKLKEIKARTPQNPNEWQTLPRHSGGPVQFQTWIADPKATEQSVKNISAYTRELYQYLKDIRDLGKDVLPTFTPEQEAANEKYNDTLDDISVKLAKLSSEFHKYGEYNAEVKSIELTYSRLAEEITKTGYAAGRAASEIQKDIDKLNELKALEIEIAREKERIRQIEAYSETVGSETSYMQIGEGSDQQESRYSKNYGMNELNKIKAGEAYNKQLQDIAEADKKLSEENFWKTYIEDIEDAKRSTEIFNDTMNVMSQSISDAFASFAVGSLSASDAFRSMIQSMISGLARLATQKGFEMLFGYLVNFASSAASSYFGSSTPTGMGTNTYTQTSAGQASGGWAGGYGAALGGIFPGGFKAFAGGGIATRPTLGLVGEGGMNEAIIPLPDGKNVPVKMQGGGNTNNFNVNVNVDGSKGGTKEQNDRLGRQIAEQVRMKIKEILIDEKRYGGVLSRGYAGRA